MLCGKPGPRRHHAPLPHAIDPPVARHHSGRRARRGLAGRRRRLRSPRRCCLHRLPLGRLQRADQPAGQRTACPDEPHPEGRPAHRVRRLQLCGVHSGHRVAVHPGDEPGGRPGRGGRRHEQRHPAARAGGRRFDLGHLGRAAVRPGDRHRAGGQGQHGRPRPDHQHRARPALGPGLRVDRRGSVPGRDAGRRRDSGRPVHRDHGAGQALRGLQPGDQPQHPGRQRDHRHPHRAGDLSACLRRLGAAGGGILGYVRLQHDQRHLRLPEPLPADHRAAAAGRLRRVRHLRLGRHPLDRALGQRRPEHGHAGQRRLLWQLAGQRGVLRPGEQCDAELPGVQRAHRDVLLRPVRRAAGRVTGADRDQRRGPVGRAADRRGRNGAAEEQRQRAAADLVRQFGCRDRLGRVERRADRRRRQRGSQLQRDGHAAAGHHRRGPQRGQRELQRRVLRQLRRRARRLVQRRGRVREQLRERGLRPQRYQPVQRGRLADLRRRRGQPAHDRRGQQRLGGDHAVAVAGRRGDGGLVPGSGGRHGDRVAAVRQHRPVRPPDRDVPGLAVPGTGQNGTVQYSEGIHVGYRWYDSQGLTPLFPFGYGLSYTSFAFSNLQVGSLVKGGAATVSATVKNTGSRAGADVAQLYVTDPAASGEPPRQLEGFARVNLQPGASKTIQFQLTQRNLQYWNSGSNNWATSTGSYGIEVGDSDANLPLSGTLPVSSGQLGQPVTVTSPGPQEELAGTPVSVPVQASDSTSGQTLSFTATSLPAGTSISSSGTISGTPTRAGTSTVTVTATDGTGAFASTSFTWTVAPAGDGIATTPLVGYQGLCLDVAGDNNTNGTKVQIYTCNGTNGQQWTEEPNGTVHADGKCLDVVGGGTANGTLVDLYQCNGTGAQVWQPQPDGALVNPQSGSCLDDTGFSTTPGTQVQIWSCTGNTNQSWVPPPDATGAVTGYAGLCLDVRGANPANGTPVQVYTCNNTKAQAWTTEPGGTLQALGKCLEVVGGGTANGTLVDLDQCNGSGAQNWQPQPDGALVNPQSGSCLDDTGFSTTPGTQVQIWSCTGNSNQVWNLP